MVESKDLQPHVTCLLEGRLWYERAMDPRHPSSEFPERHPSSRILCKFGFQDKNWQQIPREYPGTWAVERTSGLNRLVIAPANDHVDLLLKVSGQMSEPFSLIYILVSPRGAATDGRYESLL